MKNHPVFELSRKVAIVTGGAGLLGSQFSKALAASGATVVIADLNEQRCQELAAQIREETGNEALALGVDITCADEVSRMVEQVVANWGKADILVNSAQSPPIEGYFDSFEDYSAEVWESVLASDLKGTFLCCQVVGQQMLRQGHGSILNISSIYGISGPDFSIYGDSGIPSPAVYSVTKAGIIGLTRYLATYWANKGIRVNVLTPGGVFNHQDPAFVERYSSKTPMGRMADKADLIGAMLYLVSDASQYVTGHNLIVDGGWSAW